MVEIKPLRSNLRHFPLAREEEAYHRPSAHHTTIKGEMQYAHTLRSGSSLPFGSPLDNRKDARLRDFAKFTYAIA
jgi:hypothetical protein